LNLFNSPFVADQAQIFARRLETEHPNSIADQVDQAFVLALGRPPRSSEKSASLSVAKENGLATLCRVLFNSNEFLFLP